MKSITIGELRTLLDAEPRERDDWELKVWLPGSRIALGSGNLGPHGLIPAPRERIMLIEGNVEPGSAL